MDRITVDPHVCHGKPCVRGTRVMVSQILEMIAAGDTLDDVATAFPHVHREDVAAALLWAARRVEAQPTAA